ncbi:MAG: T9SS type A sorting domain-containing protein [Bacteroidota bacterium]
MKKLFTLLLCVSIAYTIQAQSYCLAQFSMTIDSSYNAVFVDMSTSQSGTVTGWFWNFGDGTSSTLQNATHQFSPSGGIYIICLTISTDDSCTSTYCDSLFIGGTPGQCSGFGVNIVVSPTSGNGVADGSIEATAFGGTPPYAYVWTTGAVTPNINNLPAGTYCVTVIDATGCEAIQCGTVWVNNQNPCQISLTYIITDESIPGAADGAIDITVFGGNPPYFYYWNTSATTEDVTGLVSGYYTVFVSDMDSCSLTYTFYVAGDSINNPCQVYVTGNVTDVSTIGGSDGAIDVTVFGGNPPYSYYWNSGATTEDINNLIAGVYTVAINDNNTCSTTATYIVNEPTNPTQYDTLFTSIVDSCFNFIYDSVFVYTINVIDSNTISVTWAFMGSGQIAFVTVEYSVYQQGYYFVVLSVNCGTKLLSTYFDLIFVDYGTISSIENVNSQSGFSIYPNPVKENLNILLDNYNSDICIIEIYNSVGQLVLNQNAIMSENRNSIRINVNNLNSGIYIINVTDANNNRLTQKFMK